MGPIRPPGGEKSPGEESLLTKEGCNGFQVNPKVKRCLHPLCIGPGRVLRVRGSVEPLRGRPCHEGGAVMGPSRLNRP